MAALAQAGAPDGSARAVDGADPAREKRFAELLQGLARSVAEMGGE